MLHALVSGCDGACLQDYSMVTPPSTTSVTFVCRRLSWSSSDRWEEVTPYSLDSRHLSRTLFSAPSGDPRSCPKFPTAPLPPLPAAASSGRPFHVQALPSLPCRWSGLGYSPSYRPVSPFLGLPKPSFPDRPSPYRPPMPVELPAFFSCPPRWARS